MNSALRKLSKSLSFLKRVPANQFIMKQNRFFGSLSIPQQQSFKLFSCNINRQFCSVSTGPIEKIVLNQECEQLLKDLSASKEASSTQQLIEKVHAQGDNLLGSDKVEEYIEFYKKAIQCAPQDSSLRCRLGTVFVMTDQAENAVEALSAGLELNPNEMGEEGLIGLASVQKMIGKDQDAIATYNKSIQLGLLPGYSHMFLALMLAETGNIEGAEVHLKAAREINPKDFTSLFAYSQTLFQKDKERGVALMKEAADGISSGNNENRFVQPEEMKEIISECNFKTGQMIQHILKDPEGAQKYYLNVLSVDPNHVESHVQYSSCLRSGSNPNIELAEEHLKKAKEIDPSKFTKKLTEWWQ